MQHDLFSASNLARSAAIPAAPVLKPHYAWPYPGLSPEDSALSGLSMSGLFKEVIALTIKRNTVAMLTDAQVEQMLPQDWVDLLGRWAHAILSPREGAQHGIRVEYVSHAPALGHHWEYRIEERHDNQD